MEPSLNGRFVLSRGTLAPLAHGNARRHGHADPAGSPYPILGRGAPRLARGELGQVRDPAAAQCPQVVRELREVWILPPDARQVVLSLGAGLCGVFLRAGHGGGYQIVSVHIVYESILALPLFLPRAYPMPANTNASHHHNAAGLF